MNNIKLSIITPYYKCLDYTLLLAEKLIPQLTDEVEWIIVDDGCYELALNMLQDLLFCEEPISYKRLNIRVIHLENNSGNASKPRNIALDNARGEFVAFVDSDDYVSNDYVEKVINKINSEDFDYCYLGWNWIEENANYIIEDEPLGWNRCVWNCIYKRSLIGYERFNENMNMDEDGDFNSRVRKKGKKANSQITDVLYYYHYRRPNSLTSKLCKGEILATK